LRGAGIAIGDPEVTRLPTMSIPLDEAAARSVLRLIDALEDLDDVQAIYANFDISDEIMAAVAG
jgi:transcriptional/translational regulatory protein YebC/TACO1